MVNKYTLLCFVLCHMILISKGLPQQLNYSAKQRRESESKSKGTECASDIIFPDKTKGNSEECNAKFTATGKGRNCVAGVCEDADDYPYEQVNKTISRLSVYSNLFGFNEGTQIISSRVKPGEPEPENLCQTTIITKYPKTLKTEGEVEKFIVNVEGHKQGVIFEMCAKPSGTCMFSDSFPTGYVSECTQKYVIRRLMALGEDGNPAFDSFIVPSCCVCSVKQVN